MKLGLAFLCVVASLPPAMAGTARPGIVGAWDCVAKDERGVQTSWILDVKQDGEILSATLQSKESRDVLTLQNVRMEGADFSFQLRINETEVVNARLKLEGDRLDGQFAGNDSGRGSLQATRRAPADVSGEWSGKWEISPDGTPGPHYMKLKQDGETVTGTAGPSPEQQIAIRNGKFANGALTFAIEVQNALSLRFRFKAEGDTLRGDAVMRMNGTESNLKLTATRVAR